MRKSVADRFSLTGSYYLDAVSNASIDVVTTASKYKETRHEFGLAGDYVYRDSRITLGGSTSHEPDYTANRFSLDISQEVFGGMTTVTLGFTRGDDKVEQEGLARVLRQRPALAVPARREPDPHAALDHELQRRGALRRRLPRQPVPRGAGVRRRRAGAQPAHPLGPRADAAPEGRPRLARRAAAPTTATTGTPGRSRATPWSSATAATSRRRWLADAYVRYYTQDKALFYSDNAQSETPTSRATASSAPSTTPRSAPRSRGCGSKEPGKYEIKLNGAYEFVHFKFKDFTDLRTGDKYAHSASILQLYVTGTF